MTTTAIVSTSLGDIRITLFADQAPKTVRNFTELAEGTKEWTDPRVRSKSTATSRATPMCPRQSARLLVTSSSTAVSAATVQVDSWLSPASASRSSSAATAPGSST